MKSENILHWGRGFSFVSTGNKKAMDFSKINKDRFDQGRPPEALDYRHEEEKNKNYKTGGISWSLDMGSALRRDET